MFWCFGIEVCGILAWTHTPCTERWSLNHWTTREVHHKVSFIIYIFNIWWSLYLKDNCMPYFKILFLVGKNSYCLRKFRTYKQKEDNALSILLLSAISLLWAEGHLLRRNINQTYCCMYILLLSAILLLYVYIAVICNMYMYVYIVVICKLIAVCIYCCYLQSLCCGQKGIF